MTERGPLVQEPRRLPFVIPRAPHRGRLTPPRARDTRDERDKLTAIPHLTPSDVVERAAHRSLPDRWTMRFAPPGLLSLGEELKLERARRTTPPPVGSAICVVSGGRLAFRRVLGSHGKALRLRCDVAPFEDAWDGEITGWVTPRPIDRLAAVSPDMWTQSHWHAAMALARTTAFMRTLRKQPPTFTFHTELLSPADWPRVRAFWLAACGTPLPSEQHERQQVVGMVVGDVLAGVNIHLFAGTTSYSAFTLVHPDYRGAGGGRAMIEHSVRLARQRETERIYVHIDARNLASIAAYENVGFEASGWWSDDADPLAAAERQWRVFELAL